MSDHVCLKLNASYMPLSIISWQDAITLWACQKAEVLETYEDRILHTGLRFTKAPMGVNDTFITSVYDDRLDSWKTALEMPAVIRLLDFVNPKKDVRFFQPFTRQNVYERDCGKCVYCGREVSKNKFTFDHVIPKSRGGKTIWQNIVCSCLKCNSKKANRTPSEAGMKLICKPYAPILAPDFQSGIIRRMRGMSRVMSNQKWKNYIYWNVELQD